MRLTRISANQSTIPLLMAIFLFGSSGCGGSKSAMSFEEFQEKQKLYCQTVADFLNTPVDWHVVVDVSGSYSTVDQPVPDALVPLIRSLPLQQGDALTVDTFSEDYYEGRHLEEVTAEWIEAVKNGGAEAKNEIEDSLAPWDNQSPHPRGKTNIEGLISRLGSHPNHSRQPNSRLYYVVLTDGMHEPEGEGKPMPLFGERKDCGHPSPFLEKLLDFVHYGPRDSFRALFLVIDHDAIKQAASRNFVLNDWRYGRSQLADCKRELEEQPGNERSEEEMHSRSLLHAARWDPGNLGIFTESIKRQIGRINGIYPCFLTDEDAEKKPAWKAGHWPTVSGFRYSTLEEVADQVKPAGPHSLSLSADVVHEQREGDQLPIAFLVSKASDRKISIMIRNGGLNEKGGHLIVGPKVELFEPNRDGVGSAWAPAFHLIEIPLPERALELYDLPWTLEARFEDQREPQPFIRVQLDEPRVGFLDSVEAAMRRLKLRGRKFAYLAFLLLAASLLTSWIYAESVKYDVKVWHVDGVNRRLVGGMQNGGEKDSSSKRDGSGEKDDDARKKGHSEGAGISTRRHFRFLYRNNNNENPRNLDEVLREDGANLEWARNNRPFFDVIPIFGVVYHLVYYRDPERKCFGGGGCEQLGFRRMDEEGDDYKTIGELVGLLYRPHTFWCASRSLLSPCAHLWKETIRTRVMRGGSSAGVDGEKRAPVEFDEDTFDVVTKTQEESVRQWILRLSAALMASLSFALSSAAFMQSLSLRTNVSAIFWICFLIPIILYAMRGSEANWRAKVGLHSASTPLVSSGEGSSGTVGQAGVSPMVFPRPSRFWLWADSAWTFALYTALVLAAFSSFFADGARNRLHGLALAVFGILFAVPLYEKIRTQIVKSRIVNRQPMNSWELFFEIFFARLCS